METQSQSPSDGDRFAPAAAWDVLRLCARLLGSLRTFFDARGFVEVETPLLSADVVIDRHIDPLEVTLPDDPRQPTIGRRLWLQTSPEAAMKRLMAAGGEAIYQITRSIRVGERGPLHNPEFTIVEWYRRDDGLLEGMQLLSDLCQTLLDAPPAERITYADAFRRHAGVDPHAASVEELAAAARRGGIVAPQSLSPTDRDGWLSLLLTHCVEPHLGDKRPTILHDYPASQAMLARLRPDNPTIAERFELYVRGVELANGYHELTDAAMLRERFSRANAERVADGKPRLPTESRLLEAMEAGLPPCAGAALGFDRLVMLAAGKQTLAEVMAFPIDRA